MFYMSTFWTRGELATRFAIWYSATVTSGAFSGLISYGLFQLKGALHGWQYLFIVEGALTIGIAVLAAVVLPKTPYTTSWLSKDEKEMCLIRMKQDSTVDVGSVWNFRESIAPFKSWQVYYWSVIGLCYGTSGSAVGSFLPQIVGLMGFGTLKTNLYTVAPNLVGAVILFCIAKSSDRFRERSGHMMLAMGITFIGWVILASLDPAKHIAVAYFACFLLCGGAMTPTVIFHSWHTSNTPTENGRIYVISFMTGAANAGGIISSLVFRKQDAPRYIPFLGTAAAFEAVGIVLIMGLRMWMVWDNHRKDTIIGKKLVSKDVSMADIKEGTSDIQWRWFV
jgi:MFS family permease